MIRADDAVTALAPELSFAPAAPAAATPEDAWPAAEPTGVGEPAAAPALPPDGVGDCPAPPVAPWRLLYQSPWLRVSVYHAEWLWLWSSSSSESESWSWSSWSGLPSPLWSWGTAVVLPAVPPVVLLELPVTPWHTWVKALSLFQSFLPFGQWLGVLVARRKTANDHLLLNAVAELINGVVVTRVLGGAAETGEVLLTAVDLAGSLGDTVLDAGIEVVGHLLGKDRGDSSEKDEGGLHDALEKVSMSS